MVQNDFYFVVEPETDGQPQTRTETSAETAARPGRHSPSGDKLTDTLWDRGTYVSGDEYERVDARDMGYRNVHQHPNEIGSLEPLDLLVIDWDHVLFDDKDVAMASALEAANRGVMVGIHTYNPESSGLGQLRRFPNVRMARNHRSLLRQFGK